MSVKPYEPIYTAKEVAEILKTSKNHVYDLMNTGRLPYLVLGSGSGNRKIRGTDLEHFIESYPLQTAEA